MERSLVNQLKMATSHCGHSEDWGLRLEPGRITTFGSTSAGRGNRHKNHSSLGSWFCCYLRKYWDQKNAAKCVSGTDDLAAP